MIKNIENYGSQIKTLEDFVTVVRQNPGYHLGSIGNKGVKNMARYKFYDYVDKTSGSHVVVCVSSYAGKPVKGRAKCAPMDEFDLDKGKELAQARCDVIIAEKRQKRALSKVVDAFQAYTEASWYLEDMDQYAKDSVSACKLAKNHLMELEKNFNGEE